MPRGASLGALELAWIKAAIRRLEAIKAQGGKRYPRPTSNSESEDEDATPNSVEQMYNQKRKNFDDADRIRDELDKMGVILEDQGGETTWKVK